MAQSSAISPSPPNAQLDDDDEYEYEYSTTETETYYLTLDLSIKSLVKKDPKDIVQNTRGGYRIEYHPIPDRTDQERIDLGLAVATQDTEVKHSTPRQDSGEENGREPHPPSPTDNPQAGEGDKEHDESEQEGEGASKLQVLELHSESPIVCYRNRIFRGEWQQNLGTEMIFTPHQPETPLPSLRSLPQDVDLLAASSARIGFRELTARPKGDPAPGEVEDLSESEKERAMAERYKRNNGVFVSVFSDKTGHRQQQAHFLEDLTALKRKRGETDAVTIIAVDAAQNGLAMNDDEETRRREKRSKTHARYIRRKNNANAEVEAALSRGEYARPKRGGSGRSRKRGNG